HLTVGEKPSSHIIHDAGEVCDPAQRRIKAITVLRGGSVDGQGVAAGIYLRIIERLQWHLEDDFVALLPRTLHPSVEAVAATGKSQGNLGRELCNRFLGAGLRDAEAANDDG